MCKILEKYIFCIGASTERPFFNTSPDNNTAHNVSAIRNAIISYTY
jgi:hypothetical protein